LAERLAGGGQGGERSSTKVQGKIQLARSGEGTTYLRVGGEKNAERNYWEIRSIPVWGGEGGGESRRANEAAQTIARGKIKRGLGRVNRIYGRRTVTLLKGKCAAGLVLWRPGLQRGSGERSLGP